MNILYAITLTAIIAFVLYIALAALLVEDAEGAPGWVKGCAFLGAILVLCLIAGSGIVAVWDWLGPL